MGTKGPIRRVFSSYRSGEPSGCWFGLREQRDLLNVELLNRTA